MILCVLQFAKDFHFILFYSCVKNTQKPELFLLDFPDSSLYNTN